MSIFSFIWRVFQGPKRKKMTFSVEGLRANRIIRLAKRRIKEAKTRSEKSVSIMTLSLANFDLTDVIEVPNPTPDNLIGSAKIVYDTCIKKGWNPLLVRWRSVSGHYSGYELMIHWGEIPDYPDETLV